MKVGDIVINPNVSKWVEKDIRPNPLFQSMVIHIGREYTTTLGYDGKQTKYHTKDIKKWTVLDSVNLFAVIFYGCREL